MKIACCMIVKDDDEVKDLSRAVNSIARYVDDVFITSTGENVSLIDLWCKKNNIKHSHFPWCKDFSKARNFNFDQAVKHDEYDYIFWMDSDDVLIGGENLRQLAENSKAHGLDIVFLTYWYGCAFDGEPSPQTFKEVQLEHMRERLIKPGTNVWKSRLHETPVPLAGHEPKYAKFPYSEKDGLNEGPIVVMHMATDELLEDKLYRNKEILELQLEDEKKVGEADPRTLLYLMKIYTEINDQDLWNKCIKMGEEYLSKSGWDMERGVCNEQMGIAYGKLGDDKMACNHFHQAIAEYPHQVLWYIRLANAYFNLKRYRECQHWMELALKIDVDNKGNDLTNIKAIKVGYAELLLNLNWNAKRDVKEALRAAEMLFKENPTEQNQQNLLFIQDAYDLNEACANVDKLSNYLHSIGDDKSIIKLLGALPVSISEQPFAINIRKKVTPPIKWLEDEICYFANFGGPFLEKWDASNLERGIGGSETAVIELAKEWTKLSWRVTVYGDPAKSGIDEHGINWLPWYYFNPKDSFNIFIQWRSWELAGKIKCKKFYVDLHDIVSNASLDLEHIRNIDKVFFKSNCHRSLLTKLPQDKVAIVGNGVRIWEDTSL